MNEEQYGSTITKLENFIQFNADIYKDMVVAFVYDIENSVVDDDRDKIHKLVDDFARHTRIYNKQRSKVRITLNPLEAESELNDFIQFGADVYRNRVVSFMDYMFVDSKYDDITKIRELVLGLMKNTDIYCRQRERINIPLCQDNFSMIRGRYGSTPNKHKAILGRV